MSGIRLSVVIPVWNEEGRIGTTIGRLVTALSEAPELDAEVLVVDDGSTDYTAHRAREALRSLAVAGRVIEQENRGRMAARRAGLDAATGTHVLFLDSRVDILPGAFPFVVASVAQGDEVWNAHVHIDPHGAPYGRFWRVVTEIAFADYFADPCTTHFDTESFDRFPKGTTCFFAPAQLVREAFGQHTTLYDDERSANDDTPVLRRLAGRTPIGISPSFACVYSPRTTLRGFVRHAFHRGMVFLDGHRHPESRFFPLVVGFYPLSVVAAMLALRRPRTAAALTAGGVVALAAEARRRRFGGDGIPFALLAPVYVLAHGAGMWRGALLAARSWSRR